MPLVKACPSCHGPIVSLGRERLGSLLRHPRRTKCPHCDTLLQGSLGYWIVAHIGGVVTAVGALCLLALTVDLISPTYTLASFVATGVGIAIMFFGVWRVRLEEVGGAGRRETPLH